MTSCDVRSDIAKKEMEKFSGTPTPVPSPTAVEKPINPADVVQVDTTLEAETIGINGDQQKKTIACTKFNNVMINGDGAVATITGVCRRIMFNGNGNKITADAATEIVFNGSQNTLTYSRFPNGKRPIVTQNRPDNTVEHVPAKAADQKQAK
ncbi:MAG: DUF3060 domain-containing protein [Pyrinomonadaceae bacterium]